MAMIEFNLIVYCVLILILTSFIIGILIEKIRLRKDITYLIEKEKTLKYIDYNDGLDKAIEIIKKY